VSFASPTTTILELQDAQRLREVINATGVVLHADLGRAPLSDAALTAVEEAARGYSNLDYDLTRGERGGRDTHVEELIRELTGAEAGFAVNNNAAGVTLALMALASDREVVISRGQLVEIGGSFRIPEMLELCGARLVEVGTTNRTRLPDYERAVGPDTVALMRVHCSDFRTVGDTEDVSIEELCALGRQRGVMVIDDIGSGALGRSGDPIAHLFRSEPTVRRSLASGCDLVCFSGDELLGGPQAGIVAGRRDVIKTMRSHPLARAVRIDKLSLAALEATLLVHRDPDRAAELPVVRALTAGEEELTSRAERIRRGIESEADELAEVHLEGTVVAVRPKVTGSDRLQARLRANDPPIIAVVRKGSLVLDPRTIGDEQVDPAVAGVVSALATR
jgi:L-seryl-tRNA(Ser) seleniumtransferase